MTHGIVDVVAYQEALLIEAAFGIAVLTMIWAALRRWLRHRERMDLLIAAQADERAVQQGAQMERVEERLAAIEQIMSGGAVPPAAQIPDRSPAPDQA